MNFLSAVGSTERFTAIIVLLGAVLTFLALIGRGALHIIHTVDKLLDELHSNTKAIEELSKSDRMKR